MKVKLKDVCEIQSGGTPNRSNRQYWDNGTINWAKISDIKGKYLFYTEEKITEEGLKNSSAKLFKNNSILYTIFATLGEVCILGIDTTTNQAIANLEIRDKNVEIEYIYYYLLSKKKIINSIGRGVAQNNINLSILKEMEIFITDIDTQKRIINILNQIENIISKYIKQIKLFDTLIKARFVEMFGDPLSNNKRWEKKKLGEKCEIITGNTPHRNNQQYYGDYIEWIKSDNINTPSIFLTKAHEYLSEVGAKVGRIVERGAVLMTCIAGSLSCIGNVGIADRKVAFNQQINAIIPSNDNPYYLYVLFELTKKELQSSVDMMLKGIVSKNKLKSQEYIFPPIELQNQFAIFVKQVDKLKSDAQKSLDKTQMLFDSLMQEFFS